jgi:hypothetical protein
MGWRSFIQWGFLVGFIGIFIFFEAINLQVVRYNLFLLLLISCAFVVVLSVWIIERRKPQQQEREGQEGHDQNI